jgi:hypothetical protein
MGALFARSAGNRATKLDRWAASPRKETMNIHEFVKNHCVGAQYDSCVQSPCPYAGFGGCQHPLHPKHAAQTLEAELLSSSNNQASADQPQPAEA